MSGRPTRLVVVGQDAPLWLTSSVLSAALRPSGVTVEVVELPARISPADVYGTWPALEALHAQLRIEEAALLRATGGTFTLGERFTGPGYRFFHAHGSSGAPIDGGDFLPLWLKARAYGLDADLADFSLTAAAATQGRLMLPDDETERFGRTDYGYHLPADAYARSLRALAVGDGVPVHSASAVRPVAGSNGLVAALELDGERRLDADFFVDASIDGVLLDTLGVAWESWRDRFPTVHLLRARGPAFRSVPPFADVRSVSEGWLSLHPAQTRTGVVFAHRGLDPEAALATASRIAGMPLADAVTRRSEPGRRAVAWTRNCVGVGGAACRFDPAFDAALHAVQLGLVHLLSLFPVGDDWQAERDEYNRLTAALFDRTRDFQSAHYLLNDWGGDGFWATARAVSASPELAHKIRTFRARGEVAMEEEETFPLDSWNALFVGHRALPESWAPGADRISPDVMRAEFRRMLGFIRDKVLTQPTHDRYLAEHCGRQAA